MLLRESVSESVSKSVRLANLELLLCKTESELKAVLTSTLTQSRLQLFLFFLFISHASESLLSVSYFIPVCLEVRQPDSAGAGSQVLLSAQSAVGEGSMGQGGEGWGSHTRSLHFPEPQNKEHAANPEIDATL